MKKIILALSLLSLATVAVYAQSRNLNRTKTRGARVDSVNTNLKSATGSDSTSISNGRNSRADSSSNSK